ncbi:MAG: hypothetical protein ACLSA2_06355 [Candidatus Gastranaerophilaceae bacterium]
MGLDIKRSDVKAVNHTLNEIAATELADDGSYPVKINESRTGFIQKISNKFVLNWKVITKLTTLIKTATKRSVEQNYVYDHNIFQHGKPKAIIEEQKILV